MPWNFPVMAGPMDQDGNSRRGMSPVDIEEFKFVTEVASAAALGRMPVLEPAPGPRFEDPALNRAAAAVAAHFGASRHAMVISTMARIMAMQDLLESDTIRPFVRCLGDDGEVTIHECVIEAAALAPLSDSLSFDEVEFLRLLEERLRLKENS